MGYVSFREGIARPPFSPSSSCYWWRGMPVQSFSFPWSWLMPWSLSWAFSSLWASSLIPSIRCAVVFFGGGRWLLPCFRDGVLAENKWTRRRKLQDIFFYLKMFWRVFNPQKDWVNTIQWVYLGILLDKSRCYRWSHTTIATFHIDKSEVLIWKSCKWQVQDLVRLIMRAQKKDQWPAWTLGRTWYTAGPSVVLRCAGTMKSQIIVRGSNHAQKNFPILMAKYGCPVCVDEVIGKDRIEQKAKSFECVVG